MAAFVHEVTDGIGVHAVFDPIGAGTVDRYAPALAKNARIHWYGFLDGGLPGFPIIEMVVANATFHPYSLFNYVEDPVMCEKGKAFAYEAIADGSIAPLIDRILPMEDYRDVWAYLKEPRTSHGKVVVETGL